MEDNFFVYDFALFFLFPFSFFFLGPGLGAESIEGTKSLSYILTNYLLGLKGSS